MSLAKYIQVDGSNKVIGWSGSADSWTRLQAQNDRRTDMGKSRTFLLFVGTDGTVIPSGTVITESDASNPFQTLADCEIDESGQVSVEGQSTVVGTIDPAVGDLNTLSSPITGVDSVSNPSPTDVGVVMETLTWKQLPTEVDLTGFVQAIHNPVDDTFTEDPSISQQDVDDKWETEVRQPALDRVVREGDEKILEIHGGLAALMGHINKKLDSNDHKGGDFNPKARRDPTHNVSLPHLKAETARKGRDPENSVDLTTTADEILAVEAVDAQREASLEDFRKTAKDSINAAVVGDTSAVDAALATWTTNLETV